jgi:hypothetical protein
VLTFRAGEQKCSGTLVHPEVFLTAAHCLDYRDPPEVRFGESFQLDQIRADVAFCVASPEHEDGHVGRGDLALCKLAEPVEGIPIAPVLMGCEAEMLVPEAPAVVVGFGIPDPQGTFGRKRYAYTEIASGPASDGTIRVGEQGVSACLGDSGGPAFLEYPDGSWHVFGVYSGGSCATEDAIYALVHPHMEWLEQEAPVDLTPCHDAAGNWDPSPDCGGFALTPLATDTTWTEHCATELSGPSETCADPGDTGSESGIGEHLAGEATAGCACATGDGALFAVLSLLVPLCRRRERHGRK